MDINDLIAIVKKKLQDQIDIEDIKIDFEKGFKAAAKISSNKS